jgi:hypothetical protein
VGFSIICYALIVVRFFSVFSPKIFLASLISNLMNSSTLQMANTKNRNVNANANNENYKGNPPPPPMLEQVLIMQA